MKELGFDGGSLDGLTKAAMVEPAATPIVATSKPVEDVGDPNPA
jgi:hypothetical protein